MLVAHRHATMMTISFRLLLGARSFDDAFNSPILHEIPNFRAKII